MPAGTANLPRFQGARPDYVRVSNHRLHVFGNLRKFWKLLRNVLVAFGQVLENLRKTVKDVVISMSK